MKKEYAVFNGNNLIAKYFSEVDALSALKEGQHVRKWITGYLCNGGWFKI